MASLQAGTTKEPANTYLKPQSDDLRGQTILILNELTNQ